jgi:hypothetical protein
MTDNVTVIEPGEHSPWGPSSSKRGINCSGSMKASKGAPDGESVYAAEGTAAHFLSELGRKHKLPCIDWLGHIFKVGEYEFTVDEEMADSAQAFNDWCAESPGTPLTEQRINYSNYFPPEAIAEFGDAFGTLDDARLNDAIVAIKDFKHGKGVQEWAADNSQLKLQALGVLEDFGYLYDIKGFNLGICQPRLSHYDTWDISVGDLVLWAMETIPGWAERAMEGTQFKAGDWCKFCRIRRKCAVRANSNVQLMLASEEFEDLDQLETHALRAQNRLQFITNEQIAKIVPALDDFIKWIKDVKVRAVLGLMNKEPGYESLKLVEGRSNRRIVDEAKFAEKLSSLEVDPYKPREVISVAVAEKTLGKKEFDRRFKKGEDWVKPPGKPKLVNADDKRPAITNANLNDFDNLDETET